MTKKKKPFFWIDLEMTGLDPFEDSILEAAVVVTDINLKPIDEYSQVVFQPPEVLDAMNDWCKEHHGKSGLTEAVAKGKPQADVEKDLIALIDKHYGEKDRVILCGNSVGNDKAFLEVHMKELSKKLHYRILDVSSFKIIFQYKYGLKFKKANSHRAVDDILESIKELETYLNYIKFEDENPKS